MTNRVRRNSSKIGSLRSITGISLRKAVSGLTLAAIALTIVLSSSFAASTNNDSINSTSYVTLFKLETTYAFVGKSPPNTSYTASDGFMMHPSSEYSSAVILKITRLNGIQVPSCDAEIEVYGVEISTDTGLVENHVYFVGTNYKSSFSNSELSVLVDRIGEIVDKSVFSDARGNFNFNWIDNASITSQAIGSVGYYWNKPTTFGLWAAGKPNAILVSIHRIGSITITDGSVAFSRERESRDATAPIQLAGYEDGFLYNMLIPTEELSQTDLFQPIP